MLQRTCKKVSIDFLNHVIPNNEHRSFRFLGISWVSRWWWWFNSFFIRGSIFLIHYMAHLIIFHDVTPVLVECVVSSWSAWTTLSTCTSFTVISCFANFVNSLSSSDWMEFEVMELQVSRRSSFISEILPSFGLSHGQLLLHSHDFCLSSVLMTLFFFFYFFS